MSEACAGNGRGRESGISNDETTLMTSFNKRKKMSMMSNTDTILHWPFRKST